MIKIILLSICILLMFSCKYSTESIDYFGQKPPDSIPVIFAPNIVSVKGRLEHGLSFSPDMKELAFGVMNKSDFSGEIYYSKKVNDKWTEPIVFEPLKDECVFLPYFSPDGKSLLYAKSRLDKNNGLTDIWILRKNNDIWNHPEKLDCPISTLTRESTACMTLDNTIYFSSNRGGNGLADLFYSSLDKGQYLNAQRIDSICSIRDEESIFVSPDARYIIFSRYVTNENGPDLFISYRNINGNWITPTRLDSSINSPEWERRPYVSIDNKYLFFTKLIFNQTGLDESDIYWVNTKRVFKPFIFNPIGDQKIKIGKKTKVTLPLNYFRDIDNEKLKLSCNQEEFNWLAFNAETKVLTMSPNLVGEFDLIFTAIDGFSNRTKDKIKVIVEE